MWLYETYNYRSGAISVKPQTIYDQVVQVTSEYLGPTADRFIGRQVENHLHKSPEDLSCADLEVLIDWMSVAASLMIEDEQKVESYIKKLHEIAQRNIKKH
jgi:hypothetical protein